MRDYERIFAFARTNEISLKVGKHKQTNSYIHNTHRETYRWRLFGFVSHFLRIENKFSTVRCTSDSHGPNCGFSFWILKNFDCTNENKKKIQNNLHNKRIIATIHFCLLHWSEHKSNCLMLKMLHKLLRNAINHFWLESLINQKEEKNIKFTYINTINGIVIYFASR